MRVQTATSKATYYITCSTVVFFLQLLSGGFPARSQEGVPSNRNYVRWAQSFLASIYPELNGKGYIASLETTFRYDVPFNENIAFNLFVGRGPKNTIIGYLGGYDPKLPPPKKPANPGPVYPDQLLSSSFQFQNDRLLTFGAKGQAVGNPEEEEKASDRVITHPEVSDAEAANILRQAGAKYGPAQREEFMKRLPTKELEQFLSKLTILSVEFPVLDENHTRGRWPEWHVRVKTLDKQGRAIPYEMWFEPFKGDLVRLSGVSVDAAHPAKE